MSIRRFLTMFVAIGLVCVCSTGQSEIVHFRMTGQITVDFAIGDLPTGIYEGAPFEVQLSYDTATPDSYSDDPQRGLYQTKVGASNFLQFRTGPAEVRAHDLWLWVGNDIEEDPTLENGRPLWEHRDDTFRMFDSQIISNFPIAPFHSIVFDWRDPTRAALHSDALPMQLDLAAFQDTWFRVSTGSLNERDSQFTIRGIVETIVVVPEPASYLLVSMGSFVLPYLRIKLRLCAL